MKSVKAVFSFFHEKVMEEGVKPVARQPRVMSPVPEPHCHRGKTDGAVAVADVTVTIVPFPQ